MIQNVLLLSSCGSGCFKTFYLYPPLVANDLKCFILSSCGSELLNNPKPSLLGRTYRVNFKTKKQFKASFFFTKAFNLFSKILWRI